MGNNRIGTVYWDNSTQHGGYQPDTTGLCRVLPPKLSIETGFAKWPFTEYADWCGEFFATKEED